MTDASLGSVVVGGGGSVDGKGLISGWGEAKAEGEKGELL